MYNIKDMVKAGKKARIVYYKLGELWYETECGFRFPVPVHDTAEIGEAKFLAEDKALVLMRYIRKYIAYLQAAQEESGWQPPHHVTGTDNPIDFPKTKNVADFPGGPLEYPEDFDSTVE